MGITSAQKCRVLRAVLDTQQWHVRGPVLTLIFSHRAPKTTRKERGSGSSACHSLPWSPVTLRITSPCPLGLLLLTGPGHVGLAPRSPIVTLAASSGPSPASSSIPLSFPSALRAGLLLSTPATPPKAGVPAWVHRTSCGQMRHSISSRGCHAVTLLSSSCWHGLSFHVGGYLNASRTQTPRGQELPDPFSHSAPSPP